MGVLSRADNQGVIIHLCGMEIPKILEGPCLRMFLASGFKMAGIHIADGYHFL